MFSSIWGRAGEATGRAGEDQRDDGQFRKEFISVKMPICFPLADAITYHP